MKKLLYTISIVLIACSAFAQDLTEALRYSNYHISGTARSAAMGNAFGALGGDFSSLSINPAGVGVYRSGEFTLTPSFGQSSIKSTYFGNPVSDTKNTISLDNLGYVASFKTGENSESGLVSVNFGLGFNKLANFSMNSMIEGSNLNNSILTSFTNYANNNKVAVNNLDPYNEQLAYNTDLLLYDNTKKEYFNDITDHNYGQSQRKTVDRLGYINEYLLSVAANFNHKFYLGATLGIHDLYFKENTNLKEWDANNNIPYFNDLTYTNYLKQTGNGVNFKIGAIFKPIEQLRLGVAFHSPTFYKINEVYDRGMTSSITYDDGVTKSKSANPNKEGAFDYQIDTPMKVILSGALVVGKVGLISVDYEMVDYSTSKIKSGSVVYDYTNDNINIGNAYKSVGNLHVGGELRVSKSFSLRAGYENFPSVYKDTYNNLPSPNRDLSYSTIAAGFGFRQGRVFFDAAVKRIMNSEYNNPYPDALNMAKYETTQDNLIFTLGYKF